MPHKMADNIHTLLAGSVSQGSVRSDDFSSNAILKYCFLSTAARHHSLHATFPRLLTFYCRIPGSRWGWGGWSQCYSLVAQHPGGGGRLWRSELMDFLQRIITSIVNLDQVYNFYWIIGWAAFAVYRKTDAAEDEYTCVGLIYYVLFASDEVTAEQRFLSLLQNISCCNKHYQVGAGSIGSFIKRLYMWCVCGFSLRFLSRHLYILYSGTVIFVWPSFSRRRISSYSAVIKGGPRCLHQAGERYKYHQNYWSVQRTAVEMYRKRTHRCGQSQPKEVSGKWGLLFFC